MSLDPYGIYARQPNPDNKTSTLPAGTGEEGGKLKVKVGIGKSKKGEWRVLLSCADAQGAVPLASMDRGEAMMLRSQITRALMDIESAKKRAKSETQTEVTDLLRSQKKEPASS